MQPFSRCMDLLGEGDLGSCILHYKSLHAKTFSLYGGVFAVPGLEMSLIKRGLKLATSACKIQHFKNYFVWEQFTGILCILFPVSKRMANRNVVAMWWGGPFSAYF